MSRNYEIAWFLHQFGAHMPTEKVQAHLTKFGSETRPDLKGSSLLSRKSKLAIEKEFLKLLEIRTIPEDLKEYELAAHKKSFGPQGGLFGAQDVDDGVKLYFPDEIVTGTMPPITPRTRFDIYSPEMAEHLDEYKYYTNRELYNLYKGDHKSNSGVTGWANRQLIHIRAQAIRECMTLPEKYDPAVAGARFKANKLRNIFMDSFANQFRSMRNFYHLFSAAKNEDWVAWRGDHYVERYVTKFMDSHPEVMFWLSDYKSLDQYFTRDLANWTLTQWAEVYGFTAELPTLHKHMDYIFRIPVIAPLKTYTGLHNLLSGIYPTNPIESFGNKLIIHEFMVEHYPLLEYKTDYIFVVLGDDLMILVDNTKFKQVYGSTWSAKLLKEQFAIFVRERYGLVSRPDKTDVLYEVGYFCKRRYSRKATRAVNKTGEHCNLSIRPLILALLSILYPEKSERGMKQSSRFIRVWQILDDSYVHPLFKEAVILIARYLKLEGHKLELPTEEEVDIYNSSESDWFMRLYDIRFSIANSPSLQYLVKRKIIE